LAHPNRLAHACELTAMRIKRFSEFALRAVAPDLQVRVGDVGPSSDKPMVYIHSIDLRRAGEHEAGTILRLFHPLSHRRHQIAVSGLGDDFQQRMLRTGNYQPPSCGISGRWLR
ncbi:MAG: hypothetical protein WD534_06305, partial [Phycisphaeraceae bacterium]